MKNLLLLTNDYPYHTGEAYLETEIEYAKDHFENIYIVSLSQHAELTRKAPDCVRVMKCDHRFKLARCLIYAFFSLFTRETFSELRAIKKLEHSPSLVTAIKAWVKCRMIKKRLDCAVKELGIDLSETVGYSYWLNEFAYFLAKRRDDFAYVFSRAHGFELRDNEVYLPFRRTVDDGLDEISFISENAKRQYERILTPIGGASERSEKHVSYLGVRSDGRLSPEGDGVFRIVSCSLVYKLKRLDLLVESLAALPEECMVEWIHFGSGADMEKIEALAKNRLEKKPNVTYRFMGQIPNTEVVEYYKTTRVSLFINVSDIEGIPVSVMEAISCGIPAAARDVGGNREVVVTGRSGYLLSPGDDPAQIGACIARFIREYGELFDRKKILEFYDENFNADKNYSAFYDRLDKAGRK